MNDEPTRTVLHYTGYTDDRGGIVAVIRQHAAAARHRCVHGVSEGFLRRTDGPALEVLVLPPVAAETIGPATIWRSRHVARAVQAWLRAEPGRVFHGHSRAGLLVALWLHRWGERRVAVSVHCYGRRRWFYRWAARRLAGRLFWLTPAMKRHYGCADASWRDCVPNGLAATPAGTIHRGPPAGGPLRLGGAGALVPWKRWDRVLAALARLPANAPVRFIHAGGPIGTAESEACARDLRRLGEQSGLKDRVEWRGWQPSSADLLREVDAVVVASDGEPFSMIALEALFAGRPVIATRGGGPDDLVLDGVNGWLVPPDGSAALAARIERCLDPATWADLRPEPAHLQRFAMAALAERWREIYAGL